MTRRKIFSLCIDERMDNCLNELKEAYGKTTRAEVFRMAITLLKVVVEGKRLGYKLTLSNEDDKVQKEIVW